jgi:hypothetical protein
MRSKAIEVKALLILLLLFILIDLPVKAQLLPGISFNTIQNIEFGAFSQGSNGGTIIISANGSRSVTGTVIPLNLGVPFHQAIFEVRAPAGTIISILHGPDVVLSGSNGGTATLRIGNTQPVSPFIITQSSTPMQVNIGGTLIVNNPLLNTGGNYNGTFNIIFMNQ